MESFNHMEEQFPQKSPRWLPIWTIPVTLISSFLILVMIRPLPWFAGHNYGPKEAVQRRGWLFSLAIGNCIVSFSPSACRIAVFFFSLSGCVLFCWKGWVTVCQSLGGTPKPRSGGRNRRTTVTKGQARQVVCTAIHAKTKTNVWGL